MCDTYSFSTFYKDKIEIKQEIIFGKPIVAAYELEKLQEWSGCIVHNDCIENYYEKYESNINSDTVSIEYLEESFIICKYDVPMKNNVYENHYVVDWRRKTDGWLASEKQVKDSFSMHKKSITTPTVEKKITNTLDFLKVILSKPLSITSPQPSP